jgi:hypothetical protein
VVKRAQVSKDRNRQPYAEIPMYSVLQEDVARVLVENAAHNRLSASRATHLRVRLSLGLILRLILGRFSRRGVGLSAGLFLRRHDWFLVWAYFRLVFRWFD